MQKRTINFSPGPAILPEPVLQEAQRDLWSIDGSGIGILEQSHRGATFKRVIGEAEADCRELAGIPDNYALLFLQGGASTQFYMLPANFLPADGTADYLVTGSWSKKAMKEARHCGGGHAACSSEDANFSYLPEERETRYSEAPAYVHFTSNNTIFGTQFRREPTPPGDTWLACDASSDIFSRPIRVQSYGPAIEAVNSQLPPDAVLLMTAEPRSMYLERRVMVEDPYRTPRLIELVRGCSDPAELADRVRALGATHLLVNLSEMDFYAGLRLKDDYWADAPPVERLIIERFLLENVRPLLRTDTLLVGEVITEP